MRITPRLGTVWIAAFSLLVAAEARASNAGKHDADTLAKEADEQPGASAAAAVDRHGKLRAITAEEARALVDGMARYVDQSSVGLTPVRQANGVMAIDLQDRFQSVSMARVSADGSAVVRCVTTRQEAEQFLAKDGKTARAKKASAKKARAMQAAPRTAAPATAMTATTPPLEEK